MHDSVLERRYEMHLIRKANPQEGSYTSYLFTEGMDKILKKVGEECAEVIIAAKNGGGEALVAECADLVYHLEVMLAEAGIPISALLAELEERAKKTGNLKVMKTTDKNT